VSPGQPHARSRRVNGIQVDRSRTKFVPAALFVAVLLGMLPDGHEIAC
jgi:hypothetical protein